MYVSIVLVLLLVLHSRVDCMTKNGTKTCSQLTSVSQNIPQTLILKNPAQGHNLKICQSNLTCCSKQMENELYMASSRVLKDAVHQQTNATYHFLTTQASLFDDYFKNLLQRATAKWHKMLYMTYKELYVQNRHIFNDFFSALNKYYVNGDVGHLDKSFDVFFQRIQSTMITLINKTLASQPGFLNCTSRRIDEIQPFGKFQSSLTNQVKQSLIQARTFVVELRAGSNVTASIIHFLTRNECRERFTKMQYCSVCEGIPNALACNATCHNTLHSCFVLDPLFHTYWGYFIRGVYVLSNRIDGHDNVEATLGQLAFDISNCIMEFQNNFISVLAKALALCPSGNRKKRAIDKSGSDLYIEGERIRRSQDFLISLSSPTKQQPAPALDTFTTEFRKQLNGIKYVWKDLPQKICGGQTFVSRDHNASCWNGIEIQKNSDKVPSLKVSSIEGHNSQQLLIQFAQQLLKLRKIVEGGETVNNVDEENASGEPDYSGSGSGSASGIDPSGFSGLRTTDTAPTYLLSKTPSSTDQIAVVATTDQSTIGYGTDESSGVEYTKAVVSTTDQSTIGYGTDESSGVEYTKTPPSSLIKSTTDDEDLSEDGSGSQTPMTDSEIWSKPTIKYADVHTKTILATEPLDDSPGGSGNMITISYFSLLLMALVGLANM